VIGAVGGTSPVLHGLVIGACAVGIGLGGLRWLRVAQREHYAVDAVSRFALRWWSCSPANFAALVAAGAGVVLAARWPPSAFATAVVVALGPVGLSVRGRTSPLAWTRRLRTLAAVWAVLEVAALVGGTLAGEGALAAAAGALAVPALVDLSCALTGPAERVLAGRHVARAAARLRRVRPTIVAITGSYGKTSTKGYVAHLLGGSRTVVASPASFNNRAGLARAVNEHLTEGTDVFVAEMGTYGRGEIAELCSWVTPDVAVITAVGPVHLERFGSEDRIVAAKAEILERAPCAVLVVDDERLGALAEACAERGVRVWRVSASSADADVAVLDADGGLDVLVGGEHFTHLASVGVPGNLGAAIAVALELGVQRSEIARLLPTVPTAAHRLEAATGNAGSIVLDDTYNANPAGARVALARLRAVGERSTRRVVVTPGMVELGSRQAQENGRFARAAARVATTIIVVGRTNRRALVRGARQAAEGGADDSPAPPVSAEEAHVIVVRRRQEAVAWVRSHLEEGDVVLYENDLPDHYP